MKDQMIQNQPSTEPLTKPIPRNTTNTIADNSASETGKDLGPRIMSTLVRYPFCETKHKPSNHYQHFILELLRSVKASGENWIEQKPRYATLWSFLYALHYIYCSKRLPHEICDITHWAKQDTKSRISLDSIFSATNPGKIGSVTMYIMRIPKACQQTFLFNCPKLWPWAKWVILEKPLMVLESGGDYKIEVSTDLKILRGLRKWNLGYYSQDANQHTC